MRIALVAPPLLPVPPVRYGGVERIVGVLAQGLVERGHDVTLFAPGDSGFNGKLVATVPQGLWNDGFKPDPGEQFLHSADVVLARADAFDVIHNHMDYYGFEMAEKSPVPVISTLHGRTDDDPLGGEIRAHPKVALIAISDSQRSFVPEGNWIATIHHGLDFTGVEPGTGGGDYLAWVGRLSPDKGIAETVDLARRARIRLRVAAKVLDPREQSMYDNVVAPAAAEGIVEFLGELDEKERDALMGGALATVMLSNWPEPFGLVAIESLALGTPLIARRSGALPEIVTNGIDGFVVDDAAQGAEAVAHIAGLDRAQIRQRALDRFSAARMLDDYEAVYRRAAEFAVHSDP
ncbi:MAG TPA: glycosyltransferase family 4 protein [Candidatus Limnocylindrales bacterium]|jgi:glycosyltransferase involved in cell wall biosynthesis